MRAFSKGLLVITGVALVLLLASGLAAQSKETGAIQGKVIDENGRPIPGVTVIIRGNRLIGGPRTAVTDSRGRYRFPALPPGRYEIEAKLEGFNPVKRKGIRLHVAQTLTIDLVMNLSRIKEEEIVVVGKSPTVDVKDSTTAAVTLSDEVLKNIPNNQFTVDIINLAPGVVDDVPFGGAQASSIAYQVDGVDVSDPEGGTAWVFIDYNVIEEARVLATGLNAEYDGFTGAILNTVTRSGGNEFEGHMSFLYQGDTWNSKNSSDPNLQPPKQGYFDINGYLGGPIKLNKMWFFVGAQYYRTKRYPAGFPEAVDYKQPRLFFKITWQATEKDRIQAFFENDVYNGVNRGADAYHDVEATLKQTSPSYAYNFSLLHVFNPTTFLDAKISGFIGYYYLDPSQGYDISGHVDWVTQRYTVNAPWYFKADRYRHQANVALNYHSDEFIKGSHDFKFGIEYERSWTRNRFGYTAGMLYVDYNGQPYLAFGYEGYDVEGLNQRFSAYAQDSWTVTDKLTINYGLRFNLYRGYLPNVGETVYKSHGWAPRIGISYDIFGDHTTVFKAHYGKYYEGFFTAYYYNLDPNRSDFVLYLWDGSKYVEVARWPYQNAYTIDDNIRHPNVDMITFSIEREIFEDASFSITYIWKKNKDIIDAVNYTGVFEPITITDPYTGQTYTVYNELNPGADKYIITNPEEGKYDICTFTPYRKYEAVELLFNKRFSNRWQLMASYIYSKTTGNYDNNFWGGFGSNVGQSDVFKDPNYQINAEGHLTYDPTHMFKLSATVILPFDISFNTYVEVVSGFTYTRLLRVMLNQGPVTFMTEPRGSRRLPTRKRVDIRLEKIFNLGEKKRLGLILDVFNLFNDDAVTRVITIAGSEFENPIGIVYPRGFRAGIRFFF